MFPITEGGRENQLGSVEVDHAFHRLLNLDGFRNILLLNHLDISELLDCGHSLGVALIPTKIVFGTYVNCTANNASLGKRFSNGPSDGTRASGTRSRHNLEDRAT